MIRVGRFSRLAAWVFAAVCAVGVLCPTADCWASETSSPATVYWEGKQLVAVRAAHLGKNSPYKDVLRRLRKDAESATKRGPYSVMDKKEVAPSGDKHDYLSYARYWWPNPKSPDGLPYIRRDGR